MGSDHQSAGYTRDGAPPRLLLCVLSLTLFLLAAPVAASARVPKSFVGMRADGPLFDRHVNLGHQFDVMAASGVGSLRMAFVWAAAEPYRSWAEVPHAKLAQFKDVDNVPISFTATDAVVGLAAQHRLSILPVILGTPGWAAGASAPGSYSLPCSNETYARYVGALVRRYGPHGSFWSTHPQIRRVPIRMWQVWNEPNLDLYWPIQPFESSYVALLRAAHDAIKRADPGAKVVLAGMPNFVWQYVADIYAVPGARKLFDAVAVHPFTAQPAGVITILQRVRDVMNQAGDSHKPMLATEVSWPSSVGESSQDFGFETTEAGQASRLAALLPNARGRSERAATARLLLLHLGRSGAPRRQVVLLRGPVSPHQQTCREAGICGLSTGCARDRTLTRSTSTATASATAMPAAGSCGRGPPPRFASQLRLRRCPPHLGESDELAPLPRSGLSDYSLDRHPGCERQRLRGVIGQSSTRSEPAGDDIVARPRQPFERLAAERTVGRVRAVVQDPSLGPEPRRHSGRGGLQPEVEVLAVQEDPPVERSEPAKRVGAREERAADRPPHLPRLERSPGSHTGAEAAGCQGGRDDCARQIRPRSRQRVDGVLARTVGREHERSEQALRAIWAQRFRGKRAQRVIEQLDVGVEQD
jgi:hypothetical protein